MLLSPILKNVEGIKTKVLQVAEESGGRDENIVPVFSVSQLAPLLSVGVLFCAKGGNFGKDTKVYSIMRSDHKYLCSVRHSTCVETSDLPEELVLTTLNVYCFLAFQVVNKTLKYIHICWLWGTTDVKPKRTVKYSGFDFFPIKGP